MTPQQAQEIYNNTVMKKHNDSVVDNNESAMLGFKAVIDAVEIECQNAVILKYLNSSSALPDAGDRADTKGASINGI